MIDAELAGAGRRDRLRGRDLLLDPRPARRRRELRRIVKQTCSDFHALTNARVVRGRHLALQGFTSTLPLGVDPLRATRRYAQRNIAHCVAAHLEPVRLPRTG